MMNKLRAQLFAAVEGIERELQRATEEENKQEIAFEQTQEKHRLEREALDSLRRELDAREAAVKSQEERLAKREQQLEHTGRWLKDTQDALDARQTIVDTQWRASHEMVNAALEEKTRLADLKQHLTHEAETIEVARRHFDDARGMTVQHRTTELTQMNHELSSSKHRPTSLPDTGTPIWIPPRRRKLVGKEENVLDIASHQYLARNTSTIPLRASADLSLPIKDGETVVSFKYFAGKGVFSKALKNSLVLYAGNEAAARVTLPSPDGTLTEVTLVVDLPTNVLMLTHNDLLVSRDGMWTASAKVALPSLFTVGVVLVLPESHLEILHVR
ncbi:hypothetical protein DIPPA_62860 [Diplonema papillatum]|nr:hypothetical protein DIPPA_62860 [Diplonema papillatum]